MDFGFDLHWLLMNQHFLRDGDQYVFICVSRGYTSAKFDQSEKIVIFSCFLMVAAPTFWVYEK